MTSWANWGNRARYTLYAPVYDLVARRLDRGRRRSLQLLTPQPGERVLIAGCGTGLDLDYLPQSVHVTATVFGGVFKVVLCEKGSATR